MAHYGYDELEWIPLGDTGWSRASVTLDARDTASDPGSTKRVIYGPGIVTYDRAPDGGVGASVERNSRAAIRPNGRIEHVTDGVLPDGWRWA
jgi:hypothetical protein